MKILNVALIIIVAVMLFLIPITASMYDFRTEVKEDVFTVTTGAGVTTANVQLVKPLYDNDTSTILLSSNDLDDSPVVSSYNSTTRALLISGLAASTTRSVTASYDYDALTSYTAIVSVISLYPYFWYILLALIPLAAVLGWIIPMLRQMG